MVNIQKCGVLLFLAEEVTVTQIPEAGWNLDR